MYLFNFRQHYLLVFVVVVDDVFVYLGQSLQIPIYMLPLFSQEIWFLFAFEPNKFLFALESNKFLFRLSKAPQYYIYAMIQNLIVLIRFLTFIFIKFIHSLVLSHHQPIQTRIYLQMPKAEHCLPNQFVPNNNTIQIFTFMH